MLNQAVPTYLLNNYHGFQFKLGQYMLFFRCLLCEGRSRILSWNCLNLLIWIKFWIENIPATNFQWKSGKKKHNFDRTKFNIQQICTALHIAEKAHMAECCNPYRRIAFFLVPWLLCYKSYLIQSPCPAYVWAYVCHSNGRARQIVTIRGGCGDTNNRVE